LNDSSSQNQSSSRQPNYEDLLGAALENNQSRIRFEAGSGSRAGVGTAIATALLITSVIASIVLGVLTTSSSGFTAAKWDRSIKIAVTITTPIFSQATSDSLCSKNETFGNLAASVLTVADASGATIGRQSLGSGTLNQVGGCTYSLVVNSPASFSGGRVYTSVAFPFGTFKTDPFDVGTSRPFQQQTFEIKLSQQ
jgi:hypothetical protein